MPARICVYYSHGPHYVRVLKRVRAKHPLAEVVALVPPAFPAEAVRPWVDQVEHTEQARYRLRDLRALARLVHQLRRGNFDQFVTLFDSTRLRLIARASGAPARICATLDGREIPLKRPLGGQLLKIAVRNLRGRLLHRQIRRVIATQAVDLPHTQQLKPRPGDTPGRG